MGKLANGIFGGVNGKVGNLIGYNLNGQQVVRTIGINNKPLSEKQLNNRLQMKVIMQFFHQMDTLIRTGFSPKAKNTTKNYHNLAIAYNKPNALTGFYPNVAIDFSKIIISVGELEQPKIIKATLTDNQVEFTWESTKNTDQVVLLAYAPATKQMVFEASGAKRAIGKEILNLKPGMENVTLALYISFVSNDRLKVANSLYLGTLSKTSATINYNNT